MQERKETHQSQSPSERILYSEIIIRKTTYCVTSVFAGNLNVAKALEELAISEIIRCINETKNQNVKEG